MQCGAGHIATWAASGRVIAPPYFSADAAAGSRNRIADGCRRRVDAGQVFGDMPSSAAFTAAALFGR